MAIRYLSPTSLSQFETNLDEFVFTRICRAPRSIQTLPMAIGSAFDAYIKCYIAKELHTFPSLKELLATQVEAHNRKDATLIGAHVFNVYKKHGAVADLMLEIGESTPHMEFEVEGEVGGVPLLGRPDLFFSLGSEERLCSVLDWKVNGIVSLSSTSPKPGYIMCKGGTRDGKPHKGAKIGTWNGVRVNLDNTFLDAQWRDQLTVYAWLVGVPLGEPFVGGIDQLCGMGGGTFGNIRVAQHRYVIGEEEQMKLLSRLKHAWEVISSGWYYRDMSREDSDARVEGLRKLVEAQPPAGSKEAWLRDVVMNRGSRAW